MSLPGNTPGLRQAAQFCLVGAFALIASLTTVPHAVAGERTNIPLKNWVGFSEFYDAGYDDLERLVTAGLPDRVLLNTRPLTRLEAARIAARATAKIRHDRGALTARRDRERL